MKAEVRFLFWVACSALLTLVTAPAFVPLLRQSLQTNFGSIFPAIPFAALLALIFTLRWGELRTLLASEASFTSVFSIRAAGAAILVVLVVLRPLTSKTVEASGIAVVLTFFGAALAINPRSKPLILPYSAIYSVGIGAPFALQWAFGQPLAAMSSGLSARLVALLGFPVAWQGTQFELLSKSGDVISGVVTPGCSSVISVTTFLGLLALMHLDLRKDVRSTVKLAAVGVLVLILLNAVRIAFLMWIGYLDGAATFWGVHNWIGYVLFLGFYLSILPVYSRMSGRGSVIGLGK